MLLLLLLFCFFRFQSRHTHRVLFHLLGGSIRCSLPTMRPLSLWFSSKMVVELIEILTSPWSFPGTESVILVSNQFVFAFSLFHKCFFGKWICSSRLIANRKVICFDFQLFCICRLLDFLFIRWPSIITFNYWASIRYEIGFLQLIWSSIFWITLAIIFTLLILESISFILFR